jgi:fused signal recognition particle receptor
MALGSIKKLFRGLARTRENIAAGIQSVLKSHEVDETTLEDLETGLLAADVGPALTMEIVDELRARAQKSTLDGAALRAAVREALTAALPAAETGGASPEQPPKVVFVVGVNGGGKTTTVGKLAAREQRAGRRAMVVAADTFRAAAVEQLERWAERAGVELLRRAEGSDPASVVFDALQAARARGVDTVFVDTAGRLHTKSNLMAELGKLARVAEREVPGAPHEVLLVVDATTGQNGLSQAQEFTRAASLTGVVLTKLDGTAKGGVALSIQRELGVPIRDVGVGEAIDDLLEFDRDAFVDGLLGEGANA